MIEVRVPVEQEGTKAVVRQWFKQRGDRVEADEPLVELETDKVAVEVPSPAGGILAEILLEVDAEAPPGSVIARIDPSGSAAVAAPAAEARSTDREAAVAPAERKALFTELRLSPSVKRALLQHDIDPARIEGTGRDGRITRADVDRAVEAATRVQGTEEPAGSPEAGPARSHDVAHDRMRLRIAENMAQSMQRAPHVTAVFECDFSAIVAHRAAHRERWAEEGIRLSYTPYLLAAAAEAMKVAPAINSRWHEDRLELFDDVNIGVGTALGDKGLIVPVVRRVQSLSLKEIARQLEALVERARAEKLSSRDVQGGTFTLSNHGVSGSLLAAPIILHQAQSAILGVGKLEKRVVVREVDGADSIQIRPMAYVTLTIDHRVVDGHQTNKWLSRFVEIIEAWPREG